eukprot:gene8492-5960_t
MISWIVKGQGERVAEKHYLSYRLNILITAGKSSSLKQENPVIQANEDGNKKGNNSKPKALIHQEQKIIGVVRSMFSHRISMNVSERNDAASHYVVQCIMERPEHPAALKWFLQ